MSDGNWMQDSVAEFHRALNQPAPKDFNPSDVRLKLRAKLILEEALETVRALGFDISRAASADPRRFELELVRVSDPDWPEIVDGLCDLLYVTFGTAVEGGFSLSGFFAEVHRSNMLKVGGPVRSDGKLLKPDTWEPPRIKYLWDRLVNRNA